MKFLNRKEPAQLPQTFQVAGVYYHITSGSDIGVENFEWTLPEDELRETHKPLEVIYHYLYPSGPVTFKLDPKNQYDKNAIKVYLDKVFVGYVPAEISESVRAGMKKHKVNAYADVSGGELMYFYNDGIAVKEDRQIKIKIEMEWS